MMHNCCREAIPDLILYFIEETYKRDIQKRMQKNTVLDFFLLVFYFWLFYFIRSAYFIYAVYASQLANNGIGL